MPTTRLTLHIPTTLATHLTRATETIGRTRKSEIVTSALRLYLGQLPEEEEPPGAALAELANHLSHWARRCRRLEEETDGETREMITCIAGDLGELSAAALLTAQREDYGGAAHLARLDLSEWIEHIDERSVLREMSRLFNLWSRRLNRVCSRSSDPEIVILARRLSQALVMQSMLAALGDQLDEPGMREEIRRTAAKHSDDIDGLDNEDDLD